MNGAPGCPRLYFGVVDVRDIADLHLRAMTNPAAKGERFLGVAGDFMSISEIAEVLKQRMARRRGACQPGNCPTGSCASSLSETPPRGRSHPSSAKRRTEPTPRPGASWTG